MSNDTIDTELAQPDSPEREITLLESWLHVLSNVDEVRKERISPAQALRILSNHPYLDMSDIPDYYNHFYDILVSATAIIESVISDDLESLNRGGENDATDNWVHYSNIFMLWKASLVARERDWDIIAPGAAIELAAIIDASTYLFGQNGLIGHLEAIGFQFSPDDVSMVETAVLSEGEEK